MSSLYITELSNGAGALQAAQLPAIAEQKVTISGTSAQSAAFQQETRMIRVHTDVACHILVGSDPTATVAKLRMAADSVEYFGVTPGHKVAVKAAD